MLFPISFFPLLVKVLRADESKRAKEQGTIFCAHHPGSQTVLNLVCSPANGSKAAGPAKPRNKCSTKSSSLMFALSCQPELSLLNTGCSEL